MAISMHAPSANINIVLEIYTYTLSGWLNTAEIEKHIYIYIRLVVILTRSQ